MRARAAMVTVVAWALLMAGVPSAAATMYVTADPERIDLGVVAVKEAHVAQVTLLVHAPSVSFGGAATHGDLVVSRNRVWRTIDDTCTGNIFYQGQRCTITVRALSSSRGQVGDTLRISYNGPGSGYSLHVPLTARFAEPPDAPTDIEAAPGDELGEATVSWAPGSDDGGAPLTGYKLLRSEDEGPWETAAWLSSVETSFDDRDRGLFSSLRYRVIALNGVGESPPSATAETRPFPLGLLN